MSIENPLWGAPRIHGELLKLGLAVAQSSVAKYMVNRRATLIRSRPRLSAAVVEFGAGFAPGRVVFLKDTDEAIAVRGLNEVNHLVSNDVFEQVLWLFYQLGVEADMPSSVVAAPPFGLHPLQEVAADLDLELSLPFVDQRRHRFMKQYLVPLVYHVLAGAT
jgi:hypothetical protein